MNGKGNFSPRVIVVSGGRAYDKKVILDMEQAAKRRNGGESMKKTEQLYEGKAKKVFATDDPDVVIVDYKDDATAFNGEKKGTIALNCDLTQTQDGIKIVKVLDFLLS